LHVADKEPLEKRLADVTLVAKELAEKRLREGRDGFAIIDIAGGQADVEQFAAIVGESDGV
jgi:hypothetical protein